MLPFAYIRKVVKCIASQVLSLGWPLEQLGRECFALGRLLGPYPL